MMFNNFPVYLRVVSAIKLKQLANLLPVFKSSGYNKFILLGRARTGSTLLHTYLNSHPQVLSLDEILHPDNKDSLKQKDLVGFLKKIVFRPYSSLIKAIGFKMFYEWQAENYDTLWTYFRQHENIKIIHLKRRNHLRTLVSLTIARNNKQWSQTVDQAGISARSKAITLSKEECIRHFEAMEQEEQQFDSLFQNHPKLEVYYEDLVKQPKPELNRVMAFLGVEKMPLFTLLTRQNPEPLAALLTNFKELEDALRNTKYHQFFNENK